MMLAAVPHCHAQDVCKTVNTILIEVHQHCCMVVKGGPWVMLYCSIFLYLSSSPPPLCEHMFLFQSTFLHYFLISNKKGMEVSMSVIINLTEHTNEFYAVHFCNFFCCLLPLHSTYICLNFFCLITCAVVYSIII